MAAHQAPPSLGFSRQEYWSALPCPPPGDLPNQVSHGAGGFFTSEPPGKPMWCNNSACRYTGCPRWHNGKESACQCRRCKKHRLNPWTGKIPWSRNGNSLQYSCLENFMDRSLVDYSPWGHKESDMTEHTHHSRCILKRTENIVTQNVLHQRL